MANERKFKIDTCVCEYYEYIDIGFVVEEVTPVYRSYRIYLLYSLYT